MQTSPWRQRRTKKKNCHRYTHAQWMQVNHNMIFLSSIHLKLTRSREISKQLDLVEKFLVPAFFIAMCCEYFLFKTIVKPPFKSLWPNETTWWQRSGSTLAQVKGLLHHGSKPLLEPVWAYHRRGPLAFILLGLYSLSGKTSYRQISWSLEAARLDVAMVVSLWNLTGTSAALLPRYLPNFRAIGKV